MLSRTRRCALSAAATSRAEHADVPRSGDDAVAGRGGQHAKAPNENLARELMELFTLGVGNYTEQDVRQAARALTGWRLDAVRQGRTSCRMLHDGPETILGKTASFDVASFADWLMPQPGVLAFIA